jgi:hypothetical protein
MPLANLKELFLADTPEHPRPWKPQSKQPDGMFLVGNMHFVVFLFDIQNSAGPEGFALVATAGQLYVLPHSCLIKQARMCACVSVSRG